MGTAISSEFVYTWSRPARSRPTRSTLACSTSSGPYAEEVFDFEGATNQIVGLLDPAHRERPREILRQIETMLAPYGVVTSLRTAKRRPRTSF